MDGPRTTYDSQTEADDIFPLLFILHFQRRVRNTILETFRLFARSCYHLDKNNACLLIIWLGNTISTYKSIGWTHLILPIRV